LRDAATIRVTQLAACAAGEVVLHGFVCRLATMRFTILTTSAFVTVVFVVGDDQVCVVKEFVSALAGADAARPMPTVATAAASRVDAVRRGEVLIMVPFNEINSAAPTSFELLFA
jgi:hypothetical protein